MVASGQHSAWRTSAFSHVFGNPATSRKRPVALRPRLTTGVPFIGRERTTRSGPRSHDELLVSLNAAAPPVATAALCRTCVLPECERPPANEPGAFSYFRSVARYRMSRQVGTGVVKESAGLGSMRRSP